MSVGEVDDRLRDMLADLQRGREALLDRQHLREVGGGGTSGGVTDDWKASVDRQLEQLHGDVRNLLYALVGGFLLLAGMIVGQAIRTDEKFSAVQASVAQVRVDQAKMDAKVDLLIERSSPAPRRR